MPLYDLNKLKIGDTIRQYRLAFRMSLNDLVKETRISKGHLSEIERGLTEPTISKLLKICNALNISIAVLIESSRVRDE